MNQVAKIFVRKNFLYYYHLVIKIRNEETKKIKEEVCGLFMKKLETKNEILKRRELTDKLFVLIDNMEEIPKTFKSSWTYIKTFLDNLYKLPNIISKIISKSNIEDVKKYLAPFFTNNFYENILSTQGIENNLMYIIYLLLKEEIDSISDINDSEKFLENTPCGYVLEQLIEKIDIQSFCKSNIFKVVQDLEWTFSGKQICLDINKITENLNKTKEIPKANTIEGNNKPQKKQKNQLRKSYTIFSGSVRDDFADSSSPINRINTFSSFDGFGEKESMKAKKNAEDSQLFNSKYIIDINPKTLDYTKYDKNDVDNVKEFIECQQKFEDKKNVFSKYSNEAFINNIFKGANSEEILSIYIVSFIKIVESINLLFKSLLDHTSVIPYSIKCICKIIYSLLQKKFPNIKRLQLNAFMSRFLFNKLLLPFLENPIFGALINEYMISPETVTNIKTVSEIVSKICTGKLYNQDENGNYTPFNRLILEKIIDVYKFYQNFEEVILPEYIIKDMNGKINNENLYEELGEPLIEKSICFCIEELYSLITNVSKIKKELFVDDSTKTISIIFDKIDKPANMKIIDEILLEKKYKEIKEEPLTKDNKKNDKKKKQAKNVQKIELCNYFLITDLMSNKEFSEIFQVKKEKAHYHIKEIKNPKDKEEKDKNNIIKIKNNICTVLYYLRELNIFDFNPISTSLNDTSHIFKELKKFVKSSYYIMNDTIPFEWYANSILESLPKLPDKYKENDYELLFKELKSDIENSLKPLNLDNLNIISDKLKYGKRKKTFYEKADKILKDITLNEKSQYILDKVKIPTDLFFCYNDKEKAMRIIEVKKDDNTLKFLDSMVFVEQSKYIKTCNIIKDFTKCFPNVVKSSSFFGENEKIMAMLKDLKIPGTIMKYIDIVKNKLKSLKNFSNEEEFKIINDKIYDFVLEKIYDKIFPTFQSDNDSKLYTLCQRLSWTEPKNFLGGKTLSIDSFLPDIISNFLKIEEEKSPRKKMEYVKSIYVFISQVQNFNGGDGSKAGVDDIINILAYAFVKAKLEMAHTNFQYLKFFVRPSSEEDQWLTQLNVVCEFVLNITPEKLNVTKEEFEENCEKAYSENNI